MPMLAMFVLGLTLSHGFSFKSEEGNSNLSEQQHILGLDKRQSHKDSEQRVSLEEKELFISSKQIIASKPNTEDITLQMFTEFQSEQTVASDNRTRANSMKSLHGTQNEISSTTLTLLVKRSSENAKHPLSQLALADKLRKHSTAPQRIPQVISTTPPDIFPISATVWSGSSVSSLSSGHLNPSLSNSKESEDHFLTKDLAKSTRNLKQSIKIGIPHVEISTIRRKTKQESSVVPSFDVFQSDKLKESGRTTMGLSTFDARVHTSKFTDNALIQSETTIPRTLISKSYNSLGTLYSKVISKVINSTASDSPTEKISKTSKRLGRFGGATKKLSTHAVGSTPSIQTLNASLSSFTGSKLKFGGITSSENGERGFSIYGVNPSVVLSGVGQVTCTGVVTGSMESQGYSVSSDRSSAASMMDFGTVSPGKKVREISVSDLQSMESALSSSLSSSHMLASSSSTLLLLLPSMSSLSLSSSTLSLSSRSTVLSSAWLLQSSLPSFSSSYSTSLISLLSPSSSANDLLSMSSATKEIPCISSPSSVRPTLAFSSTTLSILSPSTESILLQPLVAPSSSSSESSVLHTSKEPLVTKLQHLPIPSSFLSSSSSLQLGVFSTPLLLLSHSTTELFTSQPLLTPLSSSLSTSFSELQSSRDTLVTKIKQLLLSSSTTSSSLPLSSSKLPKLIRPTVMQLLASPSRLSLLSSALTPSSSPSLSSAPLPPLLLPSSAELPNSVGLLVTRLSSSPPQSPLLSLLASSPSLSSAPLSPLLLPSSAELPNSVGLLVTRLSSSPPQSPLLSLLASSTSLSSAPLSPLLLPSSAELPNSVGLLVTRLSSSPPQSPLLSLLASSPSLSSAPLSPLLLPSSAELPNSVGLLVTRLSSSPPQSPLLSLLASSPSSAPLSPLLLPSSAELPNSVGLLVTRLPSSPPQSPLLSLFASSTSLSSSSLELPTSTSLMISQLTSLSSPSPLSLLSSALSSAPLLLPPLLPNSVGLLVTRLSSSPLLSLLASPSSSSELLTSTRSTKSLLTELPSPSPTSPLMALSSVASSLPYLHHLQSSPPSTQSSRTETNGKSTPILERLSLQFTSALPTASHISGTKQSKYASNTEKTNKLSIETTNVPSRLRSSEVLGTFESRLDQSSPSVKGLVLESQRGSFAAWSTNANLQIITRELGTETQNREIIHTTYRTDQVSSSIRRRSSRLSDSNPSISVTNDVSISIPESIVNELSTKVDRSLNTLKVLQTQTSQLELATKSELRMRASLTTKETEIISSTPGILEIPTSSVVNNIHVWTLSSHRLEELETRVMSTKTAYYWKSSGTTSVSGSAQPNTKEEETKTQDNMAFSIASSHTLNTIPSSTTVVEGNLSIITASDETPAGYDTEDSDQIVLLVILATIPVSCTIILTIIIFAIIKRFKRRNLKAPRYAITLEYPDEARPRRPRWENSWLDLTINGIHIDLEIPNPAEKRQSARISGAPHLTEVQMRELQILSQECKENLEWISEVLEREIETPSAISVEDERLLCAKQRDSLYSGCSEKEKENFEVSEKIIRRESSKRGGYVSKVIKRWENRDIDSDIDDELDSKQVCTASDSDKAKSNEKEPKKTEIEGKSSPSLVKKTDDGVKVFLHPSSPLIFLGDSLKLKESKRTTDSDVVLTFGKGIKEFNLKKPEVPKRKGKVTRRSSPEREKLKKPEVPKRVGKAARKCTEELKIVKKPPIPKKPESLTRRKIEREPDNDEFESKGTLGVSFHGRRDLDTRNLPCPSQRKGPKLRFETI